MTAFNVQPGQVWRVGPHRLMCGNATDPAHVAALLDGAAVDCILTDPPYSSGGFQESGKSAGSKGTGARGAADYVPIRGDVMSTRGYTRLLTDALAQVISPMAYVFTDWRMWTATADIVEASGYYVRQMLVWAKDTPGLGSGWRSQHELILCAARHDAKGGWATSAPGNVLRARRSGNVYHPTEKPVSLIADLLAARQDDRIIYDPFAGSGSGLLACAREERIFHGMEIDPIHVRTALARCRATLGVMPSLMTIKSGTAPSLPVYEEVPPELIDIATAASEWGTSGAALHKAHQRGRITVVGRRKQGAPGGGALLFNRLDLWQYVRGHCPNDAAKTVLTPDIGVSK